MVLSGVLRQAGKSRQLATVTLAASTAWAVLSQKAEDSNNDKQSNAIEQFLSLGETSNLLEPNRASCSAPVENQSANIPSGGSKSPAHQTTGFAMRRRATLARMKQASTQATLESKYEINPEAIGEGAFGQVFVARERQTGELVAVKKIWKEFSNNQDFVQEMSALLKIRAHGGHPHICSLRENFEEEHCYSLVLDLVKGGEMFDHLVEKGAYSELDASRLIREVASALTFLHGIGLVHCDLKPENLMLSSHTESGTIKLVDFGCSENLPEFQPNAPPEPAPLPDPNAAGGGTIAYSPPEMLEGNPEDAMGTHVDMWGIGIILHIMLTGLHPFDPTAEATDEELRDAILEKRALDLNTEDTAHLSASAIDILSKLLDPNPDKRLTAEEMLEHSWVRGLTARSDVIAGSDQKLSRFRKFKSKIETKVFEELMSLSDKKDRQHHTRNAESLVERAFKSLDKEKKGFLTMDDVAKHSGDEPESHEEVKENVMTLSAFSELLGENMVNKYFPTGHVIFREGDIGEHMYFLNSGKCQVSTEHGFEAVLMHGDTFGEGGLVGEHRKRSATITAATPVHAIQIDRASFFKYMLGSSSAVAHKIKERVNKRKFGRAEFILGNQEGLTTVRVPESGVIFNEGDRPDAIYFVKEGTIDMTSQGNTSYLANPGEIFGVQSFFLKRLRGSSAVCVSDQCVLKAIPYEDFTTLSKEIPALQESLYELALRREFKRAIVRKLGVSFHELDLKDVFDAIDLDKTGKVNRDELRDLLTNLEVSMSDEELEKILETLDLGNTGFINFEEFKSVFA